MKNWGVPEIIARELLHSGQNFRGIYKSIKNDIFGLENNLYLHYSHKGHRSSKALKMESSRPGEIPKQMIPMGMWVPENMKIKNI